MINSYNHLNLLALMPCPLKVPVEEEFKNYLSKLDCDDITYIIDSNANNQLSFYDKVDDFKNIDDVPDIVISPGIKDPGGNYSILSMNLLVMVVDLTQINNLNIPKTWGDLLNDEYENKIIISGQKGFFCETTLLTIYKDYGYEGIKKLGKSVREGCHPAQMARMAGSGLKDSPTISVMPYFYTKTIQNKDKVLIIWPEDGAIVSPVTMLLKKSKQDKLKNICDFFVGEKIAKISSGAYFPSIYPIKNEDLPIKDVLAVCVIDNLSGVNTPLKIGPMLKFADIIIITKGDIVSQSEREVFSFRVKQANPRAIIITVNGITGQGAQEASLVFKEAKDTLSIEGSSLRFTMPAALCSYCLGEMQIGNDFQMGNVKKIQF